MVLIRSFVVSYLNLNKTSETFNLFHQRYMEEFFIEFETKTQLTKF